MLGIRTVTVAVSTLVLVSAGGASAQKLGSSGDFVIGAERLFGFLSTSSTTEEGPVESTTTYTQVSLLSGGGVSPYSSPRIAFDGFVTDGFSIGGTFGIANVSPETETTIMGTSATSQGSATNPAGIK